jgi:nucleotide-binding universal stress UspA family protein
MLKNIVVGVDDSDSALKAAQRAAELAATTGAVLHVVSAVDDRRTIPESVDVPEGVGTTPGEQAEAIAARVAGSLSDITTQVHASPRQGRPGEALVSVANEVGADLIVVGNRRVQGIGRLLGSVATDVAHHAPCDVYIVKTV